MCKKTCARVGAEDLIVLMLVIAGAFAGSVLGILAHVLWLAIGGAE